MIRSRRLDDQEPIGAPLPRLLHRRPSSHEIGASASAGRRAEQKLEPGRGGRLTWPVLYVVGLIVSRGAITHSWQATLRAAWAYSRWTAVSPIGGVEPTRSLGIGERAGSHGAPRRYSSRRLSRCSSTTTVRDQA